MPRRTPARMNGTADGTMRSVHSRRSLVLKARATSSRERSRFRTACCVLMRIGNTANNATVAIRGGSPSERNATAMSGTRATEGTEYRALTQGSSAL